jgi:YbbR domain-containing protein
MTALHKVLTDTLFRNWGLKLAAVGLAAVLFVLTRDEVSRTFEVPLRVVADPQRVLLTDLPPTITVQVRGPWTRLNRLQDFDLGTAALDLRVADPGPLEVDQASIVMPPGVVLAEVQYSHVDLRFEPVVSRPKRIDPRTAGEVAEGYRVTRVTVTPPTWDVRGGRSVVQGVGQLPTEVLELGGREASFTEVVAVLPLRGGVELVASAAQPARVTVRVELEPEMETRELKVPIPVPDALDPLGAIPESVTVQLSGPRLSFRDLDALKVRFPVDASVEPREARTAAGETVVELRFGWAEGVPSSVSELLSIDHGVEVVVVPAPPPPAPDPPV